VVTFFVLGLRVKTIDHAVSPGGVIVELQFYLVPFLMSLEVLVFYVLYLFNLL
jgi:hypothetical protein